VANWRLLLFAKDERACIASERFLLPADGLSPFSGGKVGAPTIVRENACLALLAATLVLIAFMKRAHC
jgi:hypothetical protein